MKSNKGLIAAIICVVVAIVGIVVGMAVTGKFRQMSGKDETTATSASQETTALPANSRPKSKLPASIVAAVYGEYSEKSTEEIAGFESLGFNTVIFELDEENAENVIPLLEKAKAANLYFGVRADISEKSDYLTSFVTGNNVDFVILSGLDDSQAEFTHTAGKICETLKATDAATVIGIEPSDFTKASENILTLIGSRADFVFLSQKTNDSASNKAFAAAQLTWSEESAPVWLCHSLEGLSEFDAAKATETISLITSSTDMALCRGIVFSHFADIASASGAPAESVINYIKTRDTYLLDKEFEITSHKSTAITVEQSRITFRGSSSPAYDLLCNGQKLSVAKNGDFSVDCELKAGANTIKFEHKGKTYTYNVTYKIKLLRSVSPSDDSTVPGGMQVEVSAVALKGAKLTVTFNGKTVQMTELGNINENDDTSPDSESDFADYSATLTTPQSTSSVQKLGKFTVKAVYGSLSETLSGGNINVSAKVIPTPPPAPPITTTTSTTQTETAPSPSESQSETSSGSSDVPSSVTVSGGVGSDLLERYSFKKDYGLGAAKICEIVDDYVETYPANTSATYSVPDCSPLPKMTVDYVENVAVFDETDTYYILASGVKVPELREERLASGVEGKITHVRISDGYVMPKNTIKVVSTACSDDKTVIVLDMNRPVAFNAKLTGQSYGLYAPGRPVTVSSLNCTGLEFVFSDTESASGSNTFMNSVLKSSKWSSDKAKSTVTLSLTLASKGKFYGYHYEYNKDGMLVITVSHKAKSLSDAVIMLDPGHGGIDPGAPCSVNITGYSNEKDINLSIATKVKELLEAEGATVIMTRSTDAWRSYTQRNDAVRERDPDMFISIHCDSSGSASATGTSAYYYRAYSQPLAKSVHDCLVSAYKNEIYKDRTDIKIDRGTNFYAFRVARVEECPAILIEYGFVSNTDECQALQSAENRDILAKATVDGIRKYLSAN